jgi:hypothetical protein
VFNQRETFKIKAMSQIQDLAIRLVTENKPGYVPIPGLTDNVQQITRNFEQLYLAGQKDLYLRKSWCTDFEQALLENRDTDRGLVFRTGGEHDLKAMLQYRLSLVSELKSRGVILTPYQDELLERCQYLWKQSYAKAYEIAKHLDTLLPGFDFADRVTRSAEDHVLRVLRYMPGRAFYAQPHYDVDFLTLALYESIPALLVEGQKVNCKKDEAFAFLGMKAQLATDLGLRHVYDAFDPQYEPDEMSLGLQAHIHGAQNIDQQEVRYAVVFFTHIDIEGLTLSDISTIQKQLVMLKLNLKRSQ